MRVFWVVWSLFFVCASFKQAQVSVRWALWTKKKKSFLLYRVKSIIQSGHVYSAKRKLKNAECIAQIKREISLAKACSTCKHHAAFFENHELSRAAFKSSKYGKHTHNPQFLQSLWRRANARSVSFETIDGGQFTLSTQLIRLKDHIKVKLTI